MQISSVRSSCGRLLFAVEYFWVPLWERFFFVGFLKILCLLYEHLPLYRHIGHKPVESNHFYICVELLTLLTSGHNNIGEDFRLALPG